MSKKAGYSVWLKIHAGYNFPEAIMRKQFSTLADANHWAKEETRKTGKRHIVMSLCTVFNIYDISQTDYSNKCGC